MNEYWTGINSNNLDSNNPEKFINKLIYDNSNFLDNIGDLEESVNIIWNFIQSDVKHPPIKGETIDILIKNFGINSEMSINYELFEEHLYSIIWMESYEKLNYDKFISKLLILQEIIKRERKIDNQKRINTFKYLDKLIEELWESMKDTFINGSNKKVQKILDEIWKGVSKQISNDTKWALLNNSINSKGLIDGLTEEAQKVTENLWKSISESFSNKIKEQVQEFVEKYFKELLSKYSDENDNSLKIYKISIQVDGILSKREQEEISKNTTNDARKILFLDKKEEA